MRSCLAQVVFFFAMPIGIVMLVGLSVVLFKARWTISLATIGFVFGVAFTAMAIYRMVSVAAIDNVKQQKPANGKKLNRSRKNTRTA